MKSLPDQIKALLLPWRQALYDFEASVAAQALTDLCTENTTFLVCHPFGKITGAEIFFEKVILPLSLALPDLERRDSIVVSGVTEQQTGWVGCCGYYTGTFQTSWLDIPATGHQISIRFHEFYQFSEQKLCQVQMIWDIPELMMQANVWPLAQSLGRDWRAPSPALQNGLKIATEDDEHSNNSRKHVADMLTDLSRHPRDGGPELMNFEKYWHPKFSWYGPAGIGTARGVYGFRQCHQIPFLKAMPDRGQDQENLDYHLFAEGDFVAVTGWPNMRQTLSDDGWLAMVPTGRKIEIRSLDFWRLEKGLIRENWVLIDLLDIWRQVGVDVFSRLRDINNSRCLSS